MDTVIKYIVNDFTELVSSIYTVTFTIRTKTYISTYIHMYLYIANWIYNVADFFEFHAF